MSRDDSYIQQMLMQAACLESEAAGVKLDAAIEMKRPFMLLRPRIYADGNAWCVLLGENMQTGVCAFGETPAKAATAFDIAWMNQTPPKLSVGKP